MRVITPPEKPVSSTTTSLEPKNHPLYVDVLEADDPTQSAGRKKKVSCLYSNGDVVIGLDAEDQEHPKLAISARRADRITWQSGRPFEVRFEDAASQVFIDPPPWRSHRKGNGVHFVQSSPARPDHPELVAGNEIELKFSVIARASENSNEPAPGVEELDPHVIVEP